MEPQMHDSTDIILERRGHRGRYVLEMPDGQAAELTFVESGPGHILVDHSWVPSQHRGRGVALRLVERAVRDARAAGTKITPLCRYVAVEFRRHPQWSDVLRS
jgi:predicted GNAT family acetyltransferase